MLMYNLSEYSDSYSMTSGRFWNYYRYKINDDETDNYDSGIKINNSKTTTSKSCKYKTKIIESTPNKRNRLNTEVVLALKHLSNFRKSLNLPLQTVKSNLT